MSGICMSDIKEGSEIKCWFGLRRIKGKVIKNYGCNMMIDTGKDKVIISNDINFIRFTEPKSKTEKG